MLGQSITKLVGLCCENCRCVSMHKIFIFHGCVFTEQVLYLLAEGKAMGSMQGGYLWAGE